MRSIATEVAWSFPVYVCWSHSWAVQKRMNWSILEMLFGGNHVLDKVQISPSDGSFPAHWKALYVTTAYTATTSAPLKLRHYGAIQICLLLLLLQALLCSIELGSIKCNLETAKIGILVALKSVIYFRFVSETIDFFSCGSLIRSY